MSIVKYQGREVQNGAWTWRQIQPSEVEGLLSAGKITSSLLPSYVDDVYEYLNTGAFPATGETGKIYVATGTNLAYRWTGSAYQVITDLSSYSTTATIASTYAPLSSPTFTGTQTLPGANVTLNANLKSTSNTITIRPLSTGHVYTNFERGDSESYAVFRSTTTANRSGCIFTSTSGTRSYFAHCNTGGSFVIEYASVAGLSYEGTAGTALLRCEADGDVAVLDGDLKIWKEGYGVSIKDGSNCRLGTATLSSGTVTVSNTAVTANSRIFLTVQSNGGTEYGHCRISARSAGTSFTITSYRGNNTTTVASGDTSVVAWQIIEPL